MELTVVTVPDCPNAPILEDRLVQAVAEIGMGAKASIMRRTVTDADQAVRWQMRGSPTLLVNGTDPFADPAVPPGLACRMYRDEDGHPQGAPSVAALRRVLAQALDRADDVAGQVSVKADALGRAGAGRVAPVQGGLRAVHQRVLRAFSETGAPPPAAVLAAVAAPHGASAEQVLAELHEADFLRLDAGGQIRAAYPFSAVATRHRVHIDDGPQVFAMCAIDALGMAAMLGRDVHITSTDPTDGRPVTAVVTPAGQANWEPETAVVFAGQQAACEPCTPTAASSPEAAAEVCCGYVNFFVSSASAQAWAKAHPHVEGRLLDLRAAVDLGVAIFGPLLTAGPEPAP